MREYKQKVIKVLFFVEKGGYFPSESSPIKSTDKFAEYFLLQCKNY